MNHSHTPDLQPIAPAYRLRILSDEQLSQLKAATLEILHNVGVHCPSEKALAIYAEHRAEVDFGSQIVRLPPDVVQEAMSHAPRFYTMGARSPAFDLRLDGTVMYCATDGCGTETIDFLTRKRRNSVKDDVAKMARVSDYLSSVGFYWPMVTAHDHAATAPLHELDASFRNTVKHVQSETVMDEATARYALEMAKVIAGDDATLRERPPLSLLVCCIAPLGQDEGGMEAALVFPNNELSRRWGVNAIEGSYLMEVDVLVIEDSDPDSGLTAEHEIIHTYTGQVTGGQWDNVSLNLELSSVLDAVGTDVPRRSLTQRMVGNLPISNSVRLR